MSAHEALLNAFAPIAARVAELDLAQPEAAEAALLEAFAPSLPELERLARAAAATGTLTPREANPKLRFGRVSKASPALSGHSLDVVDMAGPGGGHTHPRGEVSVCFPLEGSPRFVGRSGPFVVVPPGSWHVPDVTDGRMLIFYLLPEGAIVFDPAS
jgi:hypothetical protein